jgi:hypothetical protein
VTKLEVGKRGGTTKFTCSHCERTYTNSYNSVRKHLYGIMPCVENKTIGVKRLKTYNQVQAKDRNKYRREEEEAQNKSKKSRVESETSNSHRMFNGRSPSPHNSGFSPMHSRHRTISYFLEQGCRDDVDKKNFKVLYACGIPFNVLFSPY